MTKELVLPKKYLNLIKANVIPELAFKNCSVSIAVLTKHGVEQM